MLHPSIFPFLEELRENNNRDWFKDNKHKHDAARAHVLQFTQDLFERLSDENQLDGQKVFRVYRDVRFSKNKTPYKSHFGIGFHRIKPQFRGGYYLHLEPGASFFGAGFWGPNKDDLFRVRKEIEMDHEYFEKMSRAKTLTETWGTMKGDQLKTAPKGFDKEHPGINNLRFKQFIFTKEIPDELLFDAKFEQWMIDHFNTIRPFLNYMGDVLTSDLNGESIL
ncbi:MAG: DUF2461 domain-containing protein [Crocinitomicaceae bacterium]|nr:DUF2461 domain-containing protein [Crocinitomicaceae bacterium]MDG2505425.1 DUF2461 domain-containing protein [Crocinitomicaceae bacterium]